MRYRERSFSLIAVKPVMSEGSRRENERKRSKRNRDSFREIISSINDFIYPQARLNTNQCLSMVTAVFELLKYHSKGRAISNIFSEAGRDQLQPLTPPVKATTIDLDHLVDCANCIGIGFKEDGKIIYTTLNFVQKMGLQAPVIGENIQTVFRGHKQIHTMIFKNGRTCFCGHIELVSFSFRKTVNVIWKGKLILDSEGVYKQILQFNPDLP